MLSKFRVDEVSGTDASANSTFEGAETSIGETGNSLVHAVNNAHGTRHRG